MLWLYGKHLSGVVSNLKPVPQYCFMITSCTHLIIFPFLQQKRERKIAYNKAKRKLKQTKLKFSNEQNHKRKVTAQQLLELFYFFANRNK